MNKSQEILEALRSDIEPMDEHSPKVEAIYQQMRQLRKKAAQIRAQLHDLQIKVSKEKDKDRVARAKKAAPKGAVE